MNDLQVNSNRPTVGLTPRVSSSRRMLQLTVLLAAIVFVTYQDAKPSTIVALFSTTKEKEKSRKSRVNAMDNGLLNLRSKKRSGVLRTKAGDDYEREKEEAQSDEDNDDGKDDATDEGEAQDDDENGVENNDDATEGNEPSGDANANKIDDNGNTTSVDDPSISDDDLMDHTKENTATSGDEEALSTAASLPNRTADNQSRPGLGRTELQRQFYSEHYESLKQVEFSNMLLWRENFPDASFHLFFEEFDYVGNPFGDDLDDNDIPLDEKPFLYFQHLCTAAKRFNEYRHTHASKRRLPHVLFFDFGFDFGGLSEPIPNKTDYQGLNFGARHKVFGNVDQGNCSQDDIFSYLEHPDTLAVFTTQFHIFDHPKAHSLPLGLYAKRHVKAEMTIFAKNLGGSQDQQQKRQQLLMLNANALGWRKAIIDQVNQTFAEQFNMPLTNTYGADNFVYYAKMARSKFILSPFGNGLDCYRNWEALYMGCIPVLEHLNRTDGWFHVFDDLPVAWIDTFDNLTPQWLEEKYVQIMERHADYSWEKLTRHWWIDHVKSFLPDSEKVGDSSSLPDSEDGSSVYEEHDSSVVSLDLPVKIISREEKPGKVEVEPNPVHLEEEQFYTKHYQSLKDITVDNALLWRRDHPYPLFHLFLEQFDYQHEPEKRKETMPIDEKQFLYFWHLCPAVKRFNEYRQSDNQKRLPHVLFFDFGFDFGGLSEAIPNKTDELVFAKGHKVFGNVLQGNCSQDDIFSYLDHPDTLAAFTTQSHIFDHPKAHSLPLGVYTERHVRAAMETFPEVLDGTGDRKQLLMLNARGWSWRQTIMDQVNQTFAQNYDMPLTNTYGEYITEYYTELANSKFILSPYGNGLDCYRHWEALFMGCIPVLEHLNRTDGWFHVFDDLPVAWIDSFDNLTPQWLEEEYAHILARSNEYNWDKLTKQWWIDYVKGFLAPDHNAK